MPNMERVLKVRVPLDLLVWVDSAAGRQGLSRSLWVRLALLAALGQKEGLLPVVAPSEPVVAAQAAEPEPAPNSIPAVVQQTQVNGSDRARQEAAERAHWEKVARMQKIKGN